MAYNYSFNIRGKAQLRLGIQFSQISITVNEFLLGLGENEKKWYNSPSMDLGFLFQIKKFRVGMSVQNIFPTTISKENGSIISPEVKSGERQINISIANTFILSRQWNWSLAAFLRENTSLDVYDFSIYFSFRQKYFAGTTFRTADDIYWIGFVGVKFKEKLNLQFSFNTRKDNYEDYRFIESLIQYEF